MKQLVTATLALILVAGQVYAAPATNTETASGPILTSMDGMTLYTFDKDTAGVSNCVDECVANWPILAATAGDKAEGDYSVIDRADGMKQWAYKGLPLYTFVKDTAAGDMNGDGVKGVWHIARP